MTEMDNISPEDNVFVVGTTNKPDLVDPAAFRRYNLQHEVLPPDQKACSSILEIYLKDKPVDSAIDMESFSKQLTDNKFSGQDIYDLTQDSIIAMFDRTGLSKKIKANKAIPHNEYKDFKIETADLQTAFRTTIEKKMLKNKQGYLDRNN